MLKIKKKYLKHRILKNLSLILSDQKNNLKLINMKKLYFLLFTLISFASFGQTLVSENFDYGAAAGNLNALSAGNWQTHSGSTPVGYATTSLTMASYPSSGVGGSATIVGTNSEDVNRAFSAVSTGTVYASALVNISAVSTGTYFFHLMQSSSVFFGRVTAKTDGAGKILFGIGASSTLVYGTTPYNLNTTYLIVATYEISTGKSNLYVLTAPAATEPVTPEATNTAGAASAIISAIGIRQSSGIPTATIDGVRVATTWNDIMNDVAVPAINVTGTVSTLKYITGNGPSTEKSFTVAGSNLTNDITITAPTNFEISKTADSGFGTSLSMRQNDAVTTIYTRLAAGLSVGSYSGDISITSTGATTKTVILTGHVYAALTNALVITGVFDANITGALTGSSPRGIELMALKDIPDLSIFGVESANNGAGAIAEEFTFPAVAATQGQTIFVVNTGQEADFTTYFAGLTADYANGAMSINGNDAIVLYENTFMIDVFGEPAVDGLGTAWDYTDGWGYRNADSGPSTTFTAADWQLGNAGELDQSANASSSTPYPIKTYTNVLGISKQQLVDGFALYPNPVRGGLVSIQSRSNTVKNITIFDIVGKQVFQKTTTATQLNISQLKTGLYFVKVVQDGKVATRKLVVQ